MLSHETGVVSCAELCKRVSNFVAGVMDEHIVQSVALCTESEAKFDVPGAAEGFNQLYCGARGPLLDERRKILSRAVTAATSGRCCNVSSPAFGHTGKAHFQNILARNGLLLSLSGESKTTSLP